ncbi:MAG: hypothetical protein HS099_00595 [Ardenticatenaceae bacterium]|nr:hypothetical protein [Ardenticatenaceae bacterium]
MTWRWPRARYEQVDPQLRLVAAALEQAWEAALQAQAHLEQEWRRCRQRIGTRSLPRRWRWCNRWPPICRALWAAESTSLADRKRLLRTLIADVTLDSTQEAGVTHIAVRWQTGAVTRLTATRPRHGHPPTRSCWRASASWRQRAMRIRPLPPRSTAKGWSAVGT